MLVKRWGLFAALLPLTAACAPAPKRVDPLSGIGAAVNAAAKNQLTLAWLESENTKKTVAYLPGNNAARFAPGLGGKPVDPIKLVADAVAPLKARYAVVKKIGNIQKARAVGADLVVVVDIHADIGMGTFMKTIVDVGYIFLTLDGRELDRVAGQGRFTVPYPAFLHKPQKAIDEAIGIAVKALDASQLIAGFTPGAKSPAAQTPIKVYSSDVDIPSYARDEDERKFAVVVGIDKYETLPRAEFAERDAYSLRKHLLALGYPQRNIAFLTGSRASKAGIQKHVESWLKKRVKKDSKVVFYFSGHGAPDPRSGDAYLVPWNGDPKFLNDTAYPLKRLYAKLAKLKAKEIVVMMDACFSGAGGRSVLPRGTRPLVTKVDTGRGLSAKLQVLAAAGGDEITGIEAEQGHGIFTYYLLKALNDSDGGATVPEIYRFLLPKVQDAARRLDNRDQTPQLLPQSPAAASSFRL